MFNLFSKSRLLTLLTLILFTQSNSALMASECCCDIECNRAYIGAFGGGLYSNSNGMYQMGTAFFTEAEGGPLAVYAHGNTKKTSSGFGGVQVGYEWAKCEEGWSLASAFELEAYWYKQKKKGLLINTTDRLPEHDFLDSFHMDAGVYLANAVFSLNNSCFSSLSPYVGGGIGATRISINKAQSIQINFAEPGINHFNSKRRDSSWAFAAQVKAGLRYNICEAFHIFAEYRYLFVDSSNYILGSTVYPTHAPTSPWNVKVKHAHYNAFVLGIQYDL